MISSRVTSGATRWSSTTGDAPRPGKRRDPPDAPGALRLIPERFSSIVDIVPEMPTSVEGPGSARFHLDLGGLPCPGGETALGFRRFCYDPRPEVFPVTRRILALVFLLLPGALRGEETLGYYRFP